MIPQLNYLGLTFLGLGLHAAKHGEPKESKYNILHYLFNCIVTITILYYGHFFDPILK